MERLLKISEFAALSGISRKLLIFYDRQGILHPEYIDPENGYRYYSYRQIDTANVIVSFREAGMPLERIRTYLKDRSPENLICVLSEQEYHIDQQIRKLEQIRGMVQSRLKQTRRGMIIAHEKIFTQDCPEENLFLGPLLPNDYILTAGWNYLPAFYEACTQQDIQLGFTVGTLVEYEKVISGQWDKPTRYFCRLPQGQYPIFYSKPPGQYVIGTLFTDYGYTDNLYQRIFDYIEDNGLKICGNAYEEFLIDEIAEKTKERYLLQIAVQVAKS